MKIAFAGPSGTGKTTLANFISETFDIPFIKGSAGLILTEEDKKFLHDLGGYSQKGHKEVIQLSGDPIFGWNFEALVLQRRTELIMGNSEFITDRSPIDNLTYFMLQASWGVSEDDIGKIISHAQKTLMELTHIIYIPLNNPDGVIEDNDSRIPNFYFQRMVDKLFQHTIADYFSPKQLGYRRPKFLELNRWDLEFRKNAVKSFLK